jgi:hypothetical protein
MNLSNHIRHPMRYALAFALCILVPVIALVCVTGNPDVLAMRIIVTVTIGSVVSGLAILATTKQPQIKQFQTTPPSKETLDAMNHLTKAIYEK